MKEKLSMLSAFILSVSLFIGVTRGQAEALGNGNHLSGMIEKLSAHMKAALMAAGRNVERMMKEAGIHQVISGMIGALSNVTQIYHAAGAENERQAYLKTHTNTSVQRAPCRSKGEPLFLQPLKDKLWDKQLNIQCDTYHAIFVKFIGDSRIKEVAVIDTS
ncbi:hypothetical protein GJU40_03405 [Bacillus lacus]|uniref:Uncharacterized protein n=1 Tax=Metabacillus lacus TaxID=1983721 RepID=A0A7X2IY13_9BACI|nr:hypothetical protein [Metabacillus lacus]MRX71218.1 hypothetical protein [Metabacillus lacus]